MPHFAAPLPILLTAFELTELNELKEIFELAGFDKELLDDALLTDELTKEDELRRLELLLLETAGEVVTELLDKVAKNLRAH